MDILILGGTIFLGRHLVQAAHAQGHTVTLFNRGQHNPSLFPQVPKLRGDRDGGLSALANQHWDAVIDTSGYLPRVVRDSARFLQEAVPHYTFISSVSVYANFEQVGLTETAPTAQLTSDTEDITEDSYGPLKAACEQAVQEFYPTQALIIRPGLIVGPHDPSERFTYWPRRVQQGGEVLAPGQPEQRTQMIDVRDLAEWIIQMVERQQSGIYQATGPANPLTFGQMLEICHKVTQSEAEFTWVDDDFLLAHNVTPWTDLPLWLPDQPENRGFDQLDCRRALSAGLRFRPLSETIHDTLLWDMARTPDERRKVAISRKRELDLLAEWHTENTPAQS